MDIRRVRLYVFILQLQKKTHIVPVATNFTHCLDEIHQYLSILIGKFIHLMKDILRLSKKIMKVTKQYIDISANSVVCLKFFHKLL